MTVVQRVGFTPRRLAHANLWVSDLERSLSFYRDICGLNQVFDEPGISAVFLSNGNSHHDLALMQAKAEDRVGRLGQVQIPKDVGNHPGLNHLGFEMATEAELVAAYRRALDVGISMRTVNHQISRSLYLHDLDGNYLEFYCDATNDWRKVYAECADELLTEPWDPRASTPVTEELWDPQPRYEVNAAAPARPLFTARASLFVSDLDQALDFYTEVLGLTVLYTSPDRAVAVLSGSTGVPGLALVEGDSPGLHHFGLEVASEYELQASLSRLAGMGYETDLIIDKPDKHSFVLADPDGLRVEFFVARNGGGQVHLPAYAEPAYAL
ncbi:dioxygenase [Mycolicibacterium murale]|uniref:Dioxygenase n=1 Tax=Mycolicibacterium murale TaxID=182220 RepID=A0A7I9WN20_9MYCO|nr:VOC family protein [Mycolicibacterium murale]MCV7180401.1 VOC family protein [Mycolicibacterium murale]GFG58730.1 dioxygenase [Mycolicibacterium murale]